MEYNKQCTMAKPDIKADMHPEAVPYGNKFRSYDEDHWLQYYKCPACGLIWTAYDDTIGKKKS